MRVCFIPPAFRRKCLPTLRLLSLHHKKDLPSISASLAEVYAHPADFSATGQDLTVYFFVGFFFLAHSGQYCGIKTITSVWAFKRKKLGGAVSLNLLSWRQGCAGLAALLRPIPRSCPLPCSCWTPHSGEVMESLLSSSSHHLIVSFLWIPTPPKRSFPIRENPIH